MKLALLLILCLALIACQAEEVQKEETQEVKQEVKQEEQAPVIRSDFPSTGGGKIEMITMPNSPLQKGGLYEFSWSATGGEYIAETYVQISGSNDFTDYNQSAIMTNGPGIYKGKVLVQQDNMAYARVFALIDGKEYYSDVETFEVTT